MSEITFNKSYIGIRHDLLRYINGDNKAILDIGCATGSNGKFLLERGIANKVHGVEFDSEMAAIASIYYEKVYIGNLNNGNFISDICGNVQQFDYIIFGDVLEHLMDAQFVLKRLSGLLKPNGKVIISVPNIAHIELFIQVYIHGTWPRNERGIFDKTHVTWFTKKDVYSLTKNSDLEVESYNYNLRARDAIGSKFNFFLKILKVFNINWFIFQHIVVAKKNN